MDVLQLLAVIVLFLLALYWLGTYNFAVIKSFNIPGPKPWPFLGNIPDIWKYGNVFDMLLEYRKRYGKVFYACIGQKPLIVVADPELMKLITVKEFDKFRDRSYPFKLPPPNHLAVAAARGADWKRIRSTLTPTFSGAKMRQMVPFVQKSCDVFISKLRKAADTGKTVNINQYCQQYILEILMSTIFGMETNFQTEPDQKLADNVTKYLTTGVYFRNMLQALPFYPQLKGLLTYVFQVGTPIQYLNEIANQIIDQRKKQGIDIGRKDLMHLMLTTIDSEGNRMLTDDEISAQSTEFLFAGLHTSSGVLQRTLYHLARFPELQEKLYDEVQSAFQTNPDKSIYDLVQEMEYLNCFFNEVLRTGSNRLLAISRECTESCTLNGVFFPAGMQVIAGYGLMHLDAHSFKDPFKFDPERFRGPENEQRQPHLFTPFGMGPRNCIGMRLAQLEIRITIARLVKELRFMVSPEAKRQLDDLFPNLVELRVEHRLK